MRTAGSTTSRWGAAYQRTHTFASGFTVPPGALERWRAIRAQSASRQIDAIVFGDSTTWGAEATSGGYSWIDRIRDRVIGAGHTDGGKGLFGYRDSLMTLRDASYEVSADLSSNLTDATPSLQADNLQGTYYSSGDGSQSATFQGYGDHFRLWYQFRGYSGDAQLVIDGGSPIVIQTRAQPLGVAGYDMSRHFDIHGLGDGLHTVQITNLGGCSLIPPATLVGAGGSAGGSLATTGSYYYVATVIHESGTGETAASNVATAAGDGVFASRSVNLNETLAGAVVAPAGCSYALYRSTSPTGPFHFLTTVARGTSGGFNYLDNGSVTPDSGRTPPTVGTTSRSAAAKMLYFAPAFMKAAGICWQKHAKSGGTFNQAFNYGSSAPYTGGHWAYVYQTAFGLTPTQNATSPVGADGYRANNVVDTSYAPVDRVKPGLAIVHLGFNDLTAQTNTDYSIYTEAIRKFAAACRVADIDGVVLSGQLPYNAKWPTYGAGVFTAMRDQSLAEGLVFGDLLPPIASGTTALQYTGGVQNPHLFKSQYVAQADYLWDGLLGL